MRKDGTMRQMVLRIISGLCGLATIALIMVVCTVDLDEAGKWAGIGGACAGLLACALTFYLASQTTPAPAAGTPGTTVVADGGGALAAGGHAVGNATGKKAHVKIKTQAVAAPPAPGAPAPPARVRAGKRGALASGGAAERNATGKGAKVEEE
jgi:hypothetical protein